MKAFDFFRPKLVSTLRGYKRETLMADVMAGVIVGIVALPLAIAFGIASGVSPEKGIITAIIAGFLISLMGGSKVQIGGPTGAFIVIIYGIIQQYGEAGLMVATLMAGVMLVLLGVLKLGAVIKFIPYPIIVGFTSGIAVTIFTTQIADVLGLQQQAMDPEGNLLFTEAGDALMIPLKTPGDFLGKWMVYFDHLDSVNWWNTIVSIASIVIIALTPRFSKKIPGSLVAIVLVTAVVWVMKNYAGIEGIDTIGDRFSIRAELPDAVVPDLNWEAVRSLFPVALTIAVLGAIESLLSATVADGVIGDKHDSNTELIAQGVANMVTPLFGGIPATGAIARTMANINNGGRTPVAGLVHAVVLLLILLLLMPLAQYIPMGCLAGVLVIVSYNMSGWRTFKALLRNPKSDVSVLLVTFFLTVIFDLTIAIEIGLLLAIVLFLRRVMENSEIRAYSGQLDVHEGTDLPSQEVLDVEKGVSIYEIDGPFFFGIATKFDEMMRSTHHSKPVVRIIRMRKVAFVDATAIHNLELLITSSQKDGIHVVLSGVRDNVRQSLEHAGIHNLIGEDHICDHITKAVRMANTIATNNK